MTQIDTITEAVEALLEGVTPGPWKAERNSAYWEVIPKRGYEDYHIPFSVCAVCPSDPDDRTGLQQANASFIAAARELVPALLAERDALEAKLATCEKYRYAYAECDRIGTQAVRDLEAKLTKAVEALETIVDNGGAGSYHLSRTTLAELNYDERS